MERKQQALKQWVDMWDDGSFSSNDEALAALKEMNAPGYWLDRRSLYNLTPDEIKQVRQMRAEGALLREIAERFGVTKQAIHHHLNV
jgi:DNA invertase Pin-like site-specific DNA recombinase